MTASMEKYYNERASQYDADFDQFTWKVYDALTWRFLEPYLPKRRDAVVLDAGGGTGRWSIPMAEAGCSVHLVDISDRMLERAEDRIP